MRTYQETHPWLTFEADVSHCDDPEFWMLVGEAKSKCDHINGVPLLPETAAELHEVYLAKGAHGTTSIEGNTLTEDQVRKHLDGELKLPPSQEYLTQEIDNVVAAANQVAQDVRNGLNLRLTPDRIKLFNALVLRGLDLEDGVIPGECRTYSVGVPGYRGAPAEDCEYLLLRLSEWLEGDDFGACSEDTDEMAFFKTLLKALYAHLYLAWIHPFGDGNGRTARLLEVEVLLQSGRVSMPAAHLLSNYYNQTRTRYYRELDKASRLGGDTSSFLKYAVRGFTESLAQQLDLIREQHMNVTWRNYVHDRFKGNDTITGVRRRRLVLDMPREGVSRSFAARVSQRVTELYASKGPRTLARDLNALEQMGLLTREGEKYVANRDIIEAFLPLRAACDAAEEPQPDLAL